MWALSVNYYVCRAKTTISFEMYSRGLDQSISPYGIFSYIKVDGSNDLTAFDTSNGFKRGHNVVIINQTNGQFIDSVTFDTSDWNSNMYQANDQALAQYLKALPSDNIIVAVVVWDDGDGGFRTHSILQSWGCSVPMLLDREPFIFIGSPNSHIPSWQTCKKNEKSGPVIHDTYVVDLVTFTPTMEPTTNPTSFPSIEPTKKPSMEPTPIPSYDPTLFPTFTTIYFEEGIVVSSIGDTTPLQPKTTRSESIRENEREIEKSNLIYILLGSISALFCIVCIISVMIIFIRTAHYKRKESQLKDVVKAQQSVPRVQLTNSITNTVSINSVYNVGGNRSNEVMQNPEGTNSNENDFVDNSSNVANSHHHEHSRLSLSEGLFGTYTTPNGSIFIMSDDNTSVSPMTPLGE